MNDLNALANYAAKIYRRALLDLDPVITSGHKERIRRVRVAVQQRDMLFALDQLSETVGTHDHHIRFLKRAFPLLSDYEKASFLGYVWPKMQGCNVRGVAFRLFQLAAPSLKEMIPTTWPKTITVYRGRYAILGPRSHADLLPVVKRRICSGFSWTTDRESAVGFATRPSIKLLGLIGSTTVSSHDVMAYFDEMPEAGPDGPVHEKECIIDPKQIKRVTFEEVTTPLSE